MISRDEEVELCINGSSLGRRRAGLAAGYIARFRAPYARGEITAIGYRHGVETGRSSLRSAGAVRLRMAAESDRLSANRQDLAFLRIGLFDDEGVIEMLDDDQVRITLDGPASLAGFGSGAPATEESYIDDSHRTYRGRALAVIRAGAIPGQIRVRAISERHGVAEVVLIQS